MEIVKPLIRLKDVEKELRNKVDFARMGGLKQQKNATMLTIGEPLNVTFRAPVHISFRVLL